MWNPKQKLNDCQKCLSTFGPAHPSFWGSTSKFPHSLNVSVSYLCHQLGVKYVKSAMKMITFQPLAQESDCVCECVWNLVYFYSAIIWCRHLSIPFIIPFQFKTNNEIKRNVTKGYPHFHHLTLLRFIFVHYKPTALWVKWSSVRVGVNTFENMVKQNRYIRYNTQ